jgi:1-acyl-sn-glycerol-3-phosphate acyltransferase
MIWLRSAAFNLLFFGLTAAMAVGFLPALAHPAAARLVLRLWGRGVVGLLPVAGIRLCVTGLEHLPAGGCVIASKHQSAFDTVVWFALVPRATYVMKQELLRIPLYGWFARRGGMIAVDRAGGGPALRRMVRAASAAARADQQIVIFPEGTRTAPGEREPLQPGIVGLAAAADVPILPVATDSGLVWGRRSFLKHPGVIQIHIKAPLPAGLARAGLLSALAARIEFGPEPATGPLVENPGEIGDSEARTGPQRPVGTP